MRRIAVSCRPRASAATVEVIDSGRTVILDMAVRLVSAGLALRKRGGCRAISKELGDSTEIPVVAGSSSRDDRFRLQLPSVLLDLTPDLDRAVDSRRSTGESWMLKLYTESADQEPTNSSGRASENLHAVICTLRRDV
jgi:hypothetical protein